MKRYFKLGGLGAGLATAALILGACGNNGVSKGAGQEHQVAAQQLQTFDQTQPIPSFTSSQLRQNLIELETAQANTTQTTSFFFNLGVADPIQSCPSIGFPIAADTQLTNPNQIVRQGFGGGNYADGVIGNIDPTGVYTGQTTGTYVICISDQGQAYANYWEGYVQTVTGPARWNSITHHVELVGPPSAKFTK